MKRVIALLALFALFAGCSHQPKPTADVPSSEAGQDTTAPQAPPPAVKKAPKKKSTSSSSKTASAKPSSAQAAAKPTPPAPTAPAPEPNAGVVAGSSTSAPADTAAAHKEVVPQVSADERRELEKTSREQIDAARTKLAGLDAAKLDADKQKKLLIAQGFLADAIAARTQQDWMRASQLATKAKVLADELATN